MNIFKLFSKPTPQEVAQMDLEEAERLLLTHQSGMEYHNGMVQAYTTKIRRLRQYTGIATTTNRNGVITNVSTAN